jgi:serine/threonine protein kinase/Tfp pilus assembly protein PilF
MDPSVDLRSALKQRFDITSEIGRGGMGTVLLAHDTRLDRDVALKILTPEVSSALGAERFTREIRLTARLVHPNIVPLFDSGQVADSLYYVMPFIDGQTLRQRLDHEGPFSIEEALRIATDIAEALAYAHAMGVVHRDLKPENVFWYRGRALLADFGIALSTADRGSRRVTGSGIVIGSPHYISPEIADGQAATVDGRSDLYSLGCVLFELLTGQTPFAGNTFMALLVAHVTGPIPSAAALRKDLPSSVDRLLLSLMAKRPEDRPATSAAVLDRLRKASAAITVHSPRTSGRTSGDVGEQPSQRTLWAIAPEALDFFQKGRAIYLTAMHGGPGTRDKLDLAKVYLEKAFAKAPQNPEVLVALSDLIFLQGIRGFADFQVAYDRAKELRLQALSIDDKIGSVHTSIGVALLYWEDEFELSGQELQRGVELSPESPEPHRIYGSWLKIAGRLEEALNEMRLAVEQAPTAPFMHLGLADVLMTMGRYDEANIPLREALRLAPNYEPARERLEMSCHRAGRQDEALAARRAMLGTRGETARMAALDQAVATEGWVAAREADLRAALAVVLEQAAQEDPFVDRAGSRQLCDRIIITLAELGEWTQAMDWVERAYHRRPGRLRRILTDLPYDHHGLAIDPRYARLLQTAGLTELLAP